MSGSGEYGFVLELAGLARTTGSFSSTAQRIRPMALSTLPASSQPSSTRCDTYVPAVAIESMEFGASSLQPLTGDPRSATLRVTVNLDPAYPEIAAYFLGSRQVRQPNILLTTGDTLNADENSAVFETYAGVGANVAAVVSANDVLYNGREALRVQSVSTNTVTFYDAIPDPADLTATVTKTGSGAVGLRGQIGTVLANHTTSAADAAPPFIDRRWWLATPFIQGRELTVLRVDGSGQTETVWGYYVLTGSPKVNAGGTSVELEFTDLIQVLRDRRLNEEAVGGRFYDGGSITWNLDRDQRDGATLWENPQATGSSSRATTQLRAVYQIGRSGTYATLSSFPGQASNPSVRASGVFGSDPADYDELAGQPFFELLVSDPLDSSSLVGSVNPLPVDADHPYYDEDATEILSHPLDIVAAHLGAKNCPNLPEHWRVPLPAHMIDSDGIGRLKARAYPGITYPGLVAGKDGKPIEALKFVRDILTGIGAAITVTNPADTGDGGRLTIVSFIDTSWSTATAVDSSNLAMGRSATLDLGATADAIRIAAGIGLDGRPSLYLSSFDVYRSGFFPYKSDTFEPKSPGLVHPDAALTPESLNTPALNYLRTAWAQIGSLFRYPLQVIRRSVSYDAPMTCGQWVQVSDIGGRSDADGSLLDGSSAARLCLVLSVRPSRSQAFQQDVQLLVMPFDNRVISAAADVTAWDSGTTTFTLTDAEYIKPDDDADAAGVQYFYEPATSIEYDVSQFAVGSEVIVCSDNLEPLTDPVGITAIGTSGSRTITVDAVPALIGGGSYTFTSGDILTLADQSDAVAADLAVYAFVGRDEWTL